MRESNQPFKKFLNNNLNSTTNSTSEYKKSLYIANEILKRIKGISQMQPDSTLNNATNLLHFSVSLNEIVSKIENAKPVFIRCIKPNENSFSNQFVSSVVHKQVRDSGLVEFSRVRKFNYSIKFEFAQLLNR